MNSECDKCGDDCTNFNLIDRQCALEYLNKALQKSMNECSYQPSSDFLKALANVVKTNGGFGTMAEKIGVGRESLYKSLSGQVQPQWNTIIKICLQLGMNLRFLTRDMDAI